MPVELVHNNQLILESQVKKLEVDYNYSSLAEEYK